MSRRPGVALSAAGRAVGCSSVIVGAATTLLIIFGALFGSLVQVESALQVSSFSDYQLLLRQSDVQGALRLGDYREAVLLREAADCPSGPVGAGNGGVRCDLLVLVLRPPADGAPFRPRYEAFNYGRRYAMFAMPDGGPVDVLAATRAAATVRFAQGDPSLEARLLELEAAGGNPIAIPPLRVNAQGAGEALRMRLELVVEDFAARVGEAATYGGVLPLFLPLLSPLVLGPLLLAISVLRWGLHLLRRRREMAYWPGRRLPLGRYGRVIGWGVLSAAAPFLIVLPFLGVGLLDPFSITLGLSALNAAAILVVSGRLDAAP